MELDQDTKDKLLAVIAGKQMQRMIASNWDDCTMGEALEWLGKDFMRGHIRVKPEPQAMCELAWIQFPMTPHPQADILRRIADGEDLKDRIWSFSGPSNRWIKCTPWSTLLVNPDWTFAVSDKPGVPPPLPRKMIQLRPGGPKYPQGETVAPADDVEVWLARPAILNNSGRFADFYQRDESLRLGTVHLSEENYRLHMAALEDLMLWAHAGGVK